MEEQQRLSYLEALGIHQWVAKVPLLNAKTSEYIAEEESVPQEDINITSTVSLEEPNQQAEKKDVISKTADQQEPSNTSLEDPFSLHAQVFGKKGHYLILVEADSLTKDGQVLLRNILRAWGSVLGSEKETEILPETFKWPMFEAHMAPKHINQGKSAALESFNAFIYSCEKRYKNKYILVFGERIEQLVNFDHLSSERIVTSDFDVLVNSPDLKVELWGQLQSAKI